MLIAQNSRAEKIVPRGESHTPPISIFGSEPVHDWCFYFQKASLARQNGDWDVVANLGDEAQSQGLHPNDPIEWMPFLQAYAILGDQQQVKVLSTRLNTQTLYQQQACASFNSLGSLTSDMQAYVDELFCK